MSCLAPAWNDDPAPALEAAFSHIAATRMADLPIANSMLKVEAVAFRRYEKDGHWLGVLITPWAINLLLLPAPGSPWPEQGPGGKHVWHFPSGDYEFTVAKEDALGRYHLCSLFSPPKEFHSQEEARQTACAVLAALMQGGRGKADRGRRAFLGLGE